jgi:hypothetical protein
MAAWIVGQARDLAARHPAPVGRIAARAQLAGAIPAAQRVLADPYRTGGVTEKQTFV